VPGLQEAAALRFDALISSEAEQTEDVSEMLAKDDDSDSAPRGIRTHDPRFRSLAYDVPNDDFTYKTDLLCQLSKPCFVREVPSNHNPFYAVY
jgi:hypothetical protein